MIQGTAIALDIYWNLHARFYQRPNGEWKIGRYEEERRYSLRYRFCISRRWGQPSKPSEPQRLKVYKLMESKYERMTLAQILASEITILDYEAAVSRSAAPTTRVNRRVHMDKNETKQVEVVRTQCTAVPRETAKASGRCPRFMTKQNEFGLCGSHENFYKRGAEIKLIDGRILNPKTAPAVADTDGSPVAGALAHALAASEGTRVDLSTPSVSEPAKQDAITPVAPVAPESTAGAAPAPKLSKRQKVQQALAILSAKQAAKNDAAVDTGMVQRSLPDAK